MAEIESLGPLDLNFGANVRQVRQQRGLNQEQLAALVQLKGYDLHQTTIGKIERGKRRASVGEAFAIAESLSVQLPALMQPVSAAELRKSVVVAARRYVAALEALSAQMTTAEALRGELAEIVKRYDLEADLSMAPEFEVGRGAVASEYFRDLLEFGARVIRSDALAGLHPYLERFGEGE